MSDVDEDEVDAEIQKVLFMISRDMKKLKRELSAISTMIEENGSLPKTIKSANVALIEYAKQAGINLNNIVSTNSDDAEENENGEDNEENLDEREANEDQETTMEGRATLEATAESNASTQ